MSMIDQVREAISRVPAASGLDDEARLAIARAAIAAMKEPTEHMIVHADDHTAHIAEGRVEWFKRVIEAALIELDHHEEERSFILPSGNDDRAIEAHMITMAGLATDETWRAADCLYPSATLK